MLRPHRIFGRDGAYPQPILSGGVPFTDSILPMRMWFSLVVLAGLGAIQTHEVAAQSLPLKLDPPPPVASSEQTTGGGQSGNDLRRLAASHGTANIDTGLSAKLNNNLHASIHMMGAAAAVSEIHH